MIRAAIWLLCGLLAPTSAQQTPARDTNARPAAAATGAISGRVVTDEAEPHPVRRAIITLKGTGLTPSRGAISDDDGRFTIAGLPAGQFTLTAMRAAFITSTFGAKRPGRPGTTISIAAGQRVDNLVVRLWRGAVIAGTVRDETGAPVPRIPVTAMLARAPGSLLTLSNNGTETDDRGDYRIFGLEPGSYVVSAKPAIGGAGTLTALSEADVDAMLAVALRGSVTPAGSPTASAPPLPAPKPFEFAPVFYPGTTNLGSATVITLQAGQEQTGVDFPLQRVSTAVVSGIVTRADGTPASGATLQMAVAAPPGPFANSAPRYINASTDASGVFHIPQVTPGDYTLFARAPMQQPPATAGSGSSFASPGGRVASVWAQTDVSVSGVDVEGVALRLEPAMTITGRVVFDGAAPPPADLTKIQVWMRSPRTQPGPGGSIDAIAFVFPSQVKADGSFEILNVLPGRYQLTTAITGDGAAVWSARSALFDNRDLLEGEMSITRGSTEPMVLTFTDKRSEISGALQSASGAPAADIFVVAFSADRAHWMPSSRRVQAVRPDASGRYVVRGLPPGEYLVGAVTDVEPDEVTDPAFLDKLAAASAKITIGEGERKALDLRLGGVGVPVALRR